VFFILSKLIDILLSPLVWGMGLALAGLGSRRYPRLFWAPLAGVLLLWFFATDIVANALWRALEAPPQTTIVEGKTYDAVILLGGLVEDRAMLAYGQPAYNDNVERLLATRDLLVSGRARRAILSGGDGNPNGEGMVEARVLADQLVAWGIDRSRLLTEEKSRNTRENAVESAVIARREHLDSLLLVTSAFHMPRAAGSFRAVGLAVDTMAVDMRSCNCPITVNRFLPRTQSLHTSAGALREFAGRLIYRVRGYSA
jgi:uncharacterized SAM-binding protein YcdF (DUF218 family)